MVESTELIERWTHVDRVLTAMPEHERQHHWNMGTWGEINDCGTIACAAGHCGLDPWFRERGFALNFQGSRSEISNVQDFFGLEGSDRIFHNTTPRPVQAVVEEVRGYIEQLRTLYALSSVPGLPKIGEEWEEQGGIFAGSRLGIDGVSNYHLIVGPEAADYCNWNDASAWTKTLTVGPHGDYRLPTRSEQRALFDRVRSLFSRTAYWSGEQHASLSDCAWSQHFNDGNQFGWHEGNKLRARAVRSVQIQ